MKVLIWMAVWKRPEVTKLTYRGIDRIRSVMKNEFDIDTEVLVVSSEDDHTELAKSLGHHVFEYKNFPIGEKYDEGLRAALDYDWDYMFQMDSNNLVSNDFIRRWVYEANNETLFFGARKFMALLPGKKYYTDFVTRNRTAFSGVGRGIARVVFERAEEGFCPRDINSDLDGKSSRLLTLEKERYPILDLDVGIIDIKTGEDMHKHGGGEMHKLSAFKRDIMYKFPELEYWL